MTTTATKATHTPGPWEAGRASKHDASTWFAAIFGNTKAGKYCTPRPAEAHGYSKEETEANARLIAAAPELLEACQAIAALADGQGRANLMMVAGQARQAVAKATS